LDKHEALQKRKTQDTKEKAYDTKEKMQETNEKFLREKINKSEDRGLPEGWLSVLQSFSICFELHKSLMR